MNNNHKLISTCLKDLGMTANLSGYHYLRYGIEVMLEDSTFSMSMCKDVYGAIAQKFNATPAKVERCIRHAIEVSWSNMDETSKIIIFGRSAVRRGKPANSEFISNIVDYIQLNAEG